MPLSSGDRLGPYEVVAPLGAGGMGEVYKARDTRLDRTVAVKVLPNHIAQREDLRARFEREARAVASLNHPNICTLFDIGQGYMVMELIEGESLAARIEKGAMPLEQALQFAAQIADALDRAHRTGVTHRDVKPQNIMLTRDGVKVLDFGLAKSQAKPGPSDETLTAVLTSEGTIMGTPQYMAPEQFAGKEADARSDIWAFGAVLYEMVTGRKAFLGANYQSLVGAILATDPAPMAVTPFTPSWLERLVRRCLQKDPEERYQSMRDIVLELRNPPPVETVPTAAPPGARLPWITAAVLGVAAAVALWAPWRAAQSDDRPLVRLEVDLGEDVSLPNTWWSPVAISPDGTRLVYPSGSPPTLFTRRLDQPKATEIAGTQGPTWLSAFFSLDGQWIAFPSGPKLAKVSVEGGAIVPLGELRNFTGGGWDEQGNIVAGDAGAGLLWFPAGGGKSETLVNEPAFRPHMLPGGKAVLYHTISRGTGNEQYNIEVLTLAGRHRKIVAHGASPKYLPTAKGAGHLVYLDKATLFAIGFDPAKLETRGAAVPVLDDVAYYSVSGMGSYDFSPAPAGHGTLVYRKARGNSELPMRTLQWVYPTSGPNEKREPLGAKPALYGNSTLSPDGKRVASIITATQNGGRDLWVYDIQRDVTTRLTFNDITIPTWFRWSPDGQYIVFGSNKGVMQVRSDGASRAQALTDGRGAQHPRSFTGDGKRLAYSSDGGQIWTVPVEDQGGRLKAGKPELFLDRGSAPAFSPDGRWLAYQSNESGKVEVYVRAFPPPSSGAAGQWQISNSGGGVPHWPSNGRELLYQSGSQIMAVGYTAKGNAFQADKPRVWLAKLGAGSWDLAPDGKRVLVSVAVKSEEEPKPEHVIVMLQNFFDHLRQRVPLGK